MVPLLPLLLPCIDVTMSPCWIAGSIVLPMTVDLRPWFPRAAPRRERVRGDMIEPALAAEQSGVRERLPRAMVDRVPRRSRPALVAVIASLALAGCTGSLPSTSPLESPSPSVLTSPEVSGSPSGSIIPWTDATATPVPSPTPVPVPSGTETCLPADLTATAGWQGATGSMAGWLAITNVGHTPCVVDGSPRLIQLRAGDVTLDTVTYTARADAGPGSSTGVAGPVLLRPGDQAGAFLLWTNWCPPMIPAVSALLVRLPAGGTPIVAIPTSPGPGYFGTPRCDQPSSGSTFSAFAFVPVPPATPVYEPQAALVTLSVPSSVTAGGDLAFLVTLTNRGTVPAVLNPCPTYTEDLIVYGIALKPPASQQFLLNCAAIGPTLAPGASVTLQMHYAVPAALPASLPVYAPSGPVELVWGMDPGGPFDASSAFQRASLSVLGR